MSKSSAENYPSDASTLRWAAQYVRMSTDHQRYSIENQKQAIAEYASLHRIEIIRTYADSARSGLTFQGRHALQRLIADICEGKADFDLILVYDVSRWGRFQDIDESAHYEFLCRQAGVPVEYCAEEFRNDRSFSAILLKNIKRIMAGEYSRELSVKVFAGQSRIAAKGFHVGSSPLYGLRRCLIDEHGVKKMLLDPGQRKSIETDRVLLVSGPPQEVEVIKLMFSLLLDKKMIVKNITETLNARKIPGIHGRPWNVATVYSILKNEKYAGTNVYNRTSKKLGAKTKTNHPAAWIRAPHAFEPIISPERFQAAQRQLKANVAGYAKNELLDYLTATWCKHRTLSRDVIDGSPGPSANTYQAHFGSLMGAYRKVGFKSGYISNRPINRTLSQSICTEIIDSIQARKGFAKKLSDGRIRVNREFNVAVAVGRISALSRNSYSRWRFTIDRQQKIDVLVVARVDEKGTEPFDYFIVPFIYMPAGTPMQVSGSNYKLLQHYQSKTLEPLYRMCARHKPKGPSDAAQD